MTEPPTTNIQGKKFSSGSRVEKILQGVSFVVPSNWEAVEPDGEGIVLLSSKNSTALGWAFVSNQSEVGDVEKRLNEPVPFMHHVFNPSAKARRDKGIWKNSFEDAEDPSYVGLGVAFPLKEASNLLYFLVCDSAVSAHCEQAIDELLHTTQTNADG